MELNKAVELIKADLKALLGVVANDASTIRIKTIIAGSHVHFEIYAGGQSGYLIGKAGRTAASLRHMLECACHKYYALYKSPIMRVHIDVKDERGLQAPSLSAVEAKG